MAGASFDADRTYAEVQTWFRKRPLREFLNLGRSPLERICLDWLAKSGKRFRPFLVAAVYQALQEQPEALPPAVRKTAVAVECIHKASLIYDDVQDRDAERYGEKAVYAVHGVPVALTAALYLLGQGYRLIADCGATAEQRTRMLALATAGHRDLCLGQSRELMWMRRPTPMAVEEVLDLFRWKTAPSFEVVLRLPAILADAPAEVEEALKNYSLALGVGYQIQDDLSDLNTLDEPDDVAARRPSIVMAAAYARARGRARNRLRRAWCGKANRATLAAARKLVSQTGAEQEARELLRRYKHAAYDALRPLKSLDLKALLCRLADKVLPQS